MKGLRFFFCTLLLINVCSVWASEYSVRSYLDSHKGRLHPVEGIWQSTDGYKYGITYSSTISNTKYFKLEILTSPYKAIKEGEIRGCISEGSTDYIYSFEYINYYVNTGGYAGKETIIMVLESTFHLSYQDPNYGNIVSLYKLYPKDNSNMNQDNSVHNERCTGTGFFISRNGYIITNNHVVEGARNIKVTKVNGDSYKKYNAKVEVSDKQNDLAIIKITDPSFSSIGVLPYTSKFMAANIGEDCFVLGYPLVSTMGTDIKLTNGIISSRTGFNGSVSEYQMSAPVQPGNSGGPLFDKSGNIIGVVCAKHTGAENAGYAVKASYIRNLVELLPQNINFPQTNQLAGKTLPKQVELASKAVCLIIVNGD